MELLRIIGVHFLIGLGIGIGMAMVPASRWLIQAYAQWRYRRLCQRTAWQLHHLETLAQIHGTR